jgi:predicted MPP superfamily phosphohydrolase
LGRLYKYTSASVHAVAVVLRLGKLSRAPVTRSVTIPAGFGKRLVLVADLHADSAFTPRSYIAHIVDLVNTIDGVDAVVMPGDFAGHDLADAEWCAEELARLERTVIASVGNHDIGHGRQRVVDMLERNGIPVLVNDALNVDGLWIGGLDSCFAGKPDVDKMRQSVPEDSRMVVLGHEPWLATMHDETLHLAGHTHHGQIRIPGVPLRYLPRYSRPYVEGLYEVDGASGRRWVYTTAGVGSTTIPLRMFCRPEIVVLDI